MNGAGNQQLAFVFPAFFGRTEPGFTSEPAPYSSSVLELSVRGRSVLWSCCGLNGATNSSESRGENKSRLLRALLTSFVKSGRAADLGLPDHPVSCKVVSDRLGKPLLVLNDGSGPGVSFSHCNGITWAALADCETDVGIDAAQADEFGGDYPFHRVFQDSELVPLLETNDGNRREAAALAWSAKEAFVKALGCAFHLFSPLEVSVVPLGLESDRVLLCVELSDNGLERFASDRESQMEISSFRVEGIWVSVAAGNRSCIC